MPRGWLGGRPYDFQLQLIAALLLDATLHAPCNHPGSSDPGKNLNRTRVIPALSHMCRMYRQTRQRPAHVAGVVSKPSGSAGAGVLLVCGRRGGRQDQVSGGAAGHHALRKRGCQLPVLLFRSLHRGHRVCRQSNRGDPVRNQIHGKGIGSGLCRREAVHIALNCGE